MAPALWTLFIATLGLIWWFNKRRNSYKDAANKLGLKEIPGPKGLPFVGSLFDLGTVPNAQFSKWAKEYGDLFKVDLGSYTAVVVSDPKLSKELFSLDHTTGRTEDPVFALYPDEPGLGIVNSEGERWEFHRRFLLRQLRDFGFGKSAMEALIIDEVNELITTWKAKAGSPISNIKKILKLAVVNALWTIIASKRFKQDDPKLIALASSADEFNEIVEKGSISDWIPQIVYILPEWSGYNSYMRACNNVKTFMEGVISEHKQNMKEGDRNCFLDVFLEEMKKAENEPQSQFKGKTAERQLIVILFDMFLAGNETTSTSLSWAILYLCKFPQVQKKLQKEISYVTGDSRSVSVDDRGNMPYAMALLDEILRVSSIVPDGVPHRNLVDKEFKGYFLPKDVVLQPNIHFMHTNPKIWGDPENFRPERFLSADGKKYMKSENLQSFQQGRRQCVGETLARDTIFLYVTNIFQAFNIKFDPGMEKEPTLEAEIGFVRSPFPYSVVMESRLK